MNKLHGSEHLLYNCCSDSDYDTNLVDADRISCDQNDTCEKLSKAASNECSWLELDGLVSLSPPPAFIKRKEELSPRLSISSSDAFEVELRQHLFDLLHYIDDLERQVMWNIMLFMPCWFECLHLLTNLTRSHRAKRPSACFRNPALLARDIWVLTMTLKENQTAAGVAVDVAAVVMRTLVSEVIAERTAVSLNNFMQAAQTRVQLLYLLCRLTLLSLFLRNILRCQATPLLLPACAHLLAKASLFRPTVG